MRSKLIISIGVFLILASNRIKAQGDEAVVLEYDMYRASSIFNQSGKVLFGVPIYRSGKSTFLLSPEYKFFSTETNELLSAGYLNQVSFRFVWQYKLENNWRMQWLSVPVVTSPFTDKTGFLFNNALRFNKTNAVFGYSFGIAYSRRYKNNIISPIAGFTWNPSNDWNIVGRVPVYFKVQHRLNPNLFVGAELSGNSITSLSTSPDYDFVWLHERNLGLFTDWKLYKKWWLSGMLGYSLNRSIKTYNLPDRNVWTMKTTLGEPGNEPLNQLHEKGLIINIGLKYKLKD
jgi:hypothetical protein